MGPYSLHSISIIMVLIGLCLMILAIRISLSVNKIANYATRQKWAVITTLMISFLLGYSAFLYLQFHNMHHYLELITGIVFLGGALFVLLVMRLIQNTLLSMNSASRSLEKEMREHKLVSEELRESKATMDSIFNSAIPLCITGKDYVVIQANDAFHDIFGQSAQPSGKLMCFESHPGTDCHSDRCPLTRILRGETEVVSDMTKHDHNGQEKTFIVTARPFLNAQKEIIGIVESFQDITERKLSENAREGLIIELQKAFEEVNFLSGLLPICASCKKIRDDKGYWNKIESYICSHSKVEFSHSICPDCARKLYPDLYDDDILKNEE